MPFSTESFDGDGSTVDFNVNMPYIDRSHVTLVVAGSSVTFTWINDTQVRATVAPVVGTDNVVVTRTTPNATPLTDFENGSTLTEADLDRSALQLLYINQENIDSTATKMGVASDGDWDALSKPIKNVTDGSDAQDAATKGQLDAISAAAGNVTAPANPGDDNKLLKASGGTWSWANLTVSLISDAVTFMKTFLTSADVATARTNLGAQSQNDALDDIAGLTLAAGDILYADATPDVAKLAKGTDGEILTLASGLPSWAPANVGGYVPIVSVTASGVSSVEFVNGQSGVTMDGTYKSYFVLMDSVVPATDGVDLHMRVTADGGVTPTWLSGASNYEYAGVEAISSTSSPGHFNSTGASSFKLQRTTVGSAAGEAYHAGVELHGVSTVTQTTIKGINSYASADGVQRGGSLQGRTQAAIHLGIQLYFSSGNIESGTFTLYGLKDA